MEVINERCCGLDVRKKTVVACVITPQGKETRTFSTTTQGLLEMADWLVERGVSHAAMESTGFFWKPIYNLLEGLAPTLLVVNARHMKSVPGRRTDVKDAEWIADLLRHGLLGVASSPTAPSGSWGVSALPPEPDSPEGPGGEPDSASDGGSQHQAQQRGY
jgi:transposase